MCNATGVVDVLEGSSKSRSPNLFLHHSVLGKLGVFQAHCYRPTVSSFPIVCSTFIQVTCHTNLANMPCLQKFRRPFCLEHCHSYSTWPLPGSVVADTCWTHAIVESNNVHAYLLNIHSKIKFMTMLCNHLEGFQSSMIFTHQWMSNKSPGDWWILARHQLPNLCTIMHMPLPARRIPHGC